LPTPWIFSTLARAAWGGTCPAVQIGAARGPPPRGSPQGMGEADPRHQRGWT
jgi:hypothetical protein